MSIKNFISAASAYEEEVNEYFRLRPELVEALTNDAAKLSKIFEILPSFEKLLDKYNLKSSLEEEFFRRDSDFARKPSALRLLAQVFSPPWQHVNLEEALAVAIEATRESLGLAPECEGEGPCEDCDCDADQDAPISVGIAPDGGLAYMVSGEPLTTQEEEEFFERLGKNMCDVEKSVADTSNVERQNVENSVKEHDPVNNPSHYTRSASGVEAIELTEKMSFNLGNAFKYVFRRDGKGNTLQDVEKAEWYLKREIGRLENLLEVTPAANLIFMHPSLSLADMRKVDKVIEAETDENAADYYVCLFAQGPIQEPEDLESLRDALVYLQALIEEVKVQSE